MKMMMTICCPDRLITFTNCMYVASCIISWPSLITKQGPNFDLVSNSAKGMNGKSSIGAALKALFHKVADISFLKGQSGCSVSFPKKKKMTGRFSKMCCNNIMFLLWCQKPIAYTARGFFRKRGKRNNPSAQSAASLCPHESRKRPFLCRPQSGH